MTILPKIDVPTYQLKIPTTGKTIQYRPYLVKEEKILLIALEADDNNQIETAIIDVVQTCVGDTVNVRDLCMADLEYIFLKIRAVSVGEKTKIISTCSAENCNEEATLTIDLDKLEVSIPDNKDLRFDLGDNLIIDMKYPSISDRSILQSIDDDDIVVNTVAVSLKTIYYGEDIYDMSTVSHEEAVEFLGNLNVSQFAPLLDSLFKQPSVTYKTNWKCNECGNDNKIEYKGLIDFFI